MAPPVPTAPVRRAAPLRLVAPDPGTVRFTPRLRGCPDHPPDGTVDAALAALT
jgi:hypothetical protein